jgi:hypothetical protein
MSWSSRRAGWPFKPNPASKRPLPNKLLANLRAKSFDHLVGAGAQREGGTREMEAFEISTRVELPDEGSEMRRDRGREGVVLVLQALPDC